MLEKKSTWTSDYEVTIIDQYDDPLTYFFYSHIVTLWLSEIPSKKQNEKNTINNEIDFIKKKYVGINRGSKKIKKIIGVTWKYKKNLWNSQI